MWRLTYISHTKVWQFMYMIPFVREILMLFIFVHFRRGYFEEKLISCQKMRLLYGMPAFMITRFIATPEIHPFLVCFMEMTTLWCDHLRDISWYNHNLWPKCVNSKASFRKVIEIIKRKIYPKFFLAIMVGHSLIP